MRIDLPYIYIILTLMPPRIEIQPRADLGQG